LNENIALDEYDMKYMPEKNNNNKNSIDTEYIKFKNEVRLKNLDKIDTKIEN